MSETSIQGQEIAELKRVMIERYQQLIRVMDALPPHERELHFNMREWSVETDCGTTMCAAGFCGMDSWFRSQGFSLEKGFSGKPVPQYRGESGWFALDGFFKKKLNISVNHVFEDPNSVDEVIAAAKKQINRIRRHRK